MSVRERLRAAHRLVRGLTSYQQVPPLLSPCHAASQATAREGCAHTRADWRHTVVQSCRTFCAQPTGNDNTAKNAKYQGGISWATAGFTLSAALGLYAYFQVEQKRHQASQAKAMETSVGKAQVGGPFELWDTRRKRFSSEQLRGEFAILYFGFTHCPDICPDELEKMGEALDLVESTTGRKVQPVFITIDPERDTARLIETYVKEFHPRMIGLRGSMAEISKVAKLFRVYFMKTNDSPKDYLVDHSIIMYLLDPEGEFVTFYGKNFTADQIAASLRGLIEDWAKEHAEYQTSR